MDVVIVAVTQDNCKLWKLFYSFPTNSVKLEKAELFYTLNNNNNNNKI